MRNVTPVLESKVRRAFAKENVLAEYPREITASFVLSCIDQTCRTHVTYTGRKIKTRIQLTVNSVSASTIYWGTKGVERKRTLVHAPYILFMHSHKNVGPSTCSILLVALILRFVLLLSYFLILSCINVCFVSLLLE